MPVTRKKGLPPLVMPSEAGEIAAALAATSTAKASDAPGPHHVRVQRGTGAERIIRPAAPLALTP